MQLKIKMPLVHLTIIDTSVHNVIKSLKTHMQGQLLPDAMHPIIDDNGQVVCYVDMHMLVFFQNGEECKYDPLAAIGYFTKLDEEHVAQGKRMDKDFANFVFMHMEDEA